LNLKNIVWLASFPKSGNTWVRMLFDAYILGEEPDINKMVTSVSDDHAARFQLGDKSQILDFPLEYQLLARPMAMLRLATAFRANRLHPDLPLLCKTHCANMSASGVELMPHQLTKASIYLVRDPRDVVISFSKHMGIGIDEAIEQMQKANLVTFGSEMGKVADIICSWSRNVESWAGDDLHNTKTFRYEDLRAYPEEMFAQMLAHVGMPVDKERVTLAVELSSLDRMRRQEQEKGFVEASEYQKKAGGFFGKGAAGGWKKKLTQPQARTLERVFAKQMRRYGYLDGKVRKMRAA
jgi:hypothetical protein